MSKGFNLRRCALAVCMTALLQLPRLQRIADVYYVLYGNDARYGYDAQCVGARRPD